MITQYILFDRFTTIAMENHSYTSGYINYTVAKQR